MTLKMKVPYLSHGLPIVESPVDRFLVLYFSAGAICSDRAPFRVRPDAHWETGAIADTIRRVAAARLPQHLLAFLTEHPRH